LRDGSTEEDAGAAEITDRAATRERVRPSIRVARKGKSVSSDLVEAEPVESVENMR